MIKEADQPNSEEFVRLDWRLTGKGVIPCKVSEGLFSSERMITFEVGETSFAFFIAEDFLENKRELKNGEKISDLVKVSVIQENHDNLIVVVNGDPIGNHGTHLEIPKNLICGIKVPKSLIHSV